MASQRTVVCADATTWIKEQDRLDSTVTSLPDWDEVNMGFTNWLDWFADCVLNICTRVQNGYAVFYQTDRKYQSKLVSKSNMVISAALRAGLDLKQHKIILRRGEGKVDLFRPTYTHLMVFSRGAKQPPPYPDVFERGMMTYPNAMGLTAARYAVGLCVGVSDTIFDPFCGRGTILAVANKLGLNAVGVDILEEQCEFARKLEFI